MERDKKKLKTELYKRKMKWKICNVAWTKKNIYIYKVFSHVRYEKTKKKELERNLLYGRLDM